MKINLKHAEIKGSLFLKYQFERIDTNSKDKITTTSDAPIHEDLRKAFRTLIPHFAFICEEVKNKSLTSKAIASPEIYLFDREEAPDETFFKYRVNSFTLKDEKGFDKVVLSGFKQLDNNEEISFGTYDFDLSDNEYPFIREFNNHLDALKEEVLAYMQGKHAPIQQTEMFGDEDGEE